MQQKKSEKVTMNFENKGVEIANVEEDQGIFGPWIIVTKDFHKRIKTQKVQISHQPQVVSKGPTKKDDNGQGSTGSRCKEWCRRLLQQIGGKGEDKGGHP